MPITRRLATPLLLLLLTAPPAAAQIGCGGVIDAGEKITLTEDIDDCTSTAVPALTITGPATVDMAGFRVICDGADPNGPTGILLEGKGVKLSNGGVARCGTGLRVAGEGSHKITNFVSEDHEVRGIEIDSDKNKLKNVASNDNGDRAINVNGDKNKFENVAAAFNDNDGLHVDGSKNQLKRGLFVSNESDGLEFDGNDNKAKDVFVANNNSEGVEFDGDGNTLDKAIVTQGTDPNDADPDDPGVQVDGADNQVKNSLVNDNKILGIRTSPGAANNKITKNVAIGNADGDLVDDSAGGTCGTNKWTKNTFGSAFADNDSDPECIE